LKWQQRRVRIAFAPRTVQPDCFERQTWVKVRERFEATVANDYQSGGRKVPTGRGASAPLRVILRITDPVNSVKHPP
jgi:hypothetical protein